MLMPNTNLKQINKYVVNIRKKTIGHIEKILKYPFLDESFKKAAQKELERLKEYDKKKRPYYPYKELDYITKLYDSNIFEQKQANKELLDMLQTPLKLREGKPYKFFYKVLQIVVFKRLHNDANIPIEKAKSLTADIINEYFKKHGLLIANMIIDKIVQVQGDSFTEIATENIHQRLSVISSLKYKDIDNALHS